MTGVSTDIGASFVKPAGKIGDVLHARGVLIAMGERCSESEMRIVDVSG
jgi:acyl-coenzyme A thioesterase 13